MQLGSPFDALHNAIASATHKDLPDIKYQDRNWAEYKNGNKDAYIDKIRRPSSYDVEVIMFPQTWGSTALGYGGIGGSAMTPAYTVIVTDGTTSCVYFGSGGHLAYKIDAITASHEGVCNFNDDMRNFNMADVRQSAKRYK